MKTQQTQAQAETQAQTEEHPKLIDRLAAAFAGNGEVTRTPTEKVSDGERVVGRIENPALKHLFHLMYETADELRAVIPEEAPKGIVETAVFVEAMEPIKEDLGVVHTLFWSLLDREYPAGGDEDYLGVREGWRVVRFREPPKTRVIHVISELTLVDLALLVRKFP